MKRNLFNELKEGFTALESVPEGRITLRQHIVGKKSAYHSPQGLGADQRLNLRPDGALCQVNVICFADPAVSVKLRVDLCCHALIT